MAIINAFDPEIIALGGGVSKAGSFCLKPLREKVAKYVFYKDLPYAKIEIATLGSDAGIIGAAHAGQVSGNPKSGGGEHSTESIYRGFCELSSAFLV